MGMGIHAQPHVSQYHMMRSLWTSLFIPRVALLTRYGIHVMMARLLYGKYIYIAHVWICTHTRTDMRAHGHAHTYAYCTLCA